MAPALQSLLISSDDKVVRVLRRVLSELEIGIEYSPDVDTAVQKLTRQRFEAIVVDCASQQIAATILKGARSAPAHKRAISVAIIDGQSALKGAFELGAHFVLFRPVSIERTKSCFRSVRALMKRERRRHERLPVELPVELRFEGAAHKIDSMSRDLGENGLAIKATKRKLPPSFRVRFSLPANAGEIDCQAELAWESAGLLGIRFRELPTDMSHALKSWIARQLAGGEPDEPPVSCKLTDLSLSACYLETESPFPVRTRLQMMMKAAGTALEIEGIVRVMHPGAGMGLEFTRNSPAARAQVEEFIQVLVHTAGAVPDIEVLPDAIDNSPSMFSQERIGSDHGDPLLSLFRTKAELPLEIFRAELRKQRGVQQPAGA